MPSSVMGGTPESGMEYVCEACGESCVSDWTAEEAEAEAQNLWGDLPVGARSIICDDCFQRGMPGMVN